MHSANKGADFLSRLYNCCKDTLGNWTQNMSPHFASTPKSSSQVPQVMNEARGLHRVPISHS